MYLLIPSAKLVDAEMQHLGRLPPIIYPLNDGTVFDYLWRQYGSVSDWIDIVCYESSDKIHESLRNFQSDKVRFIDLPQFSDLGHTIYFGLKDENTAVVINFADTVVLDSIISEGGDSFFYSEDYVSEAWTYFRMDRGQIKEVVDKRSDRLNTNAKEKLFVGVFFISDGGAFRRCLEEAFKTPRQEISSFYHALMLYSETHEMNAKKTDNWFDIGHEDRYYNSKLEVRAREFNHITIDRNRGILKKTSDDYEKFKGEIQWYIKIPSEVEYARPRIFSYSTSYDGAFVSMEYYSYHTLHELFLYGDLGYNQWEDIFRRVRFVCNDFGKFTLRDDGLKDALKSMYLDKTMKRLDMLRGSKPFSAFFQNKICVNGMYYPSLDNICRLLKDEIPRRLFDVDEFRIIHGDLCFSNIMIDSNFSFVKLIDPRGQFGRYDIYGDFRYELAKLFHSIDGKYDFIIKDLFSVEIDTEAASVNFKIQDRKRDYDVFKIFKNVFRGEIGDDIEQLELIEALLFLSMIPLHSESLDRQMVMLGTGIEILGRLFDIRDIFRSRGDCNEHDQTKGGIPNGGI